MKPLDEKIDDVHDILEGIVHGFGVKKVYDHSCFGRLRDSYESGYTCGYDTGSRNVAYKIAAALGIELPETKYEDDDEQ